MLDDAWPMLFDSKRGLALLSVEGIALAVCDQHIKKIIFAYLLNLFFAPDGMSLPVVAMVEAGFE